MVIDCTGWIEPLSLQCLLVNYFAGSMILFFLISLIAIAIMATRFKMINTTVLVLFAFFAIIMAQSMPAFLVLVLVVAGLMIGFSIAKIAKGN